MTRFRVGECFRSARVARGLRIVQVARLAGLRDNARTLRRIAELEQSGMAPVDLVNALCGFFGIPLDQVREAWKLDEADRKRLRWESTGGRPYLVVRFMPAVYRQSAAPGGLDREGLIAWARSVLLERWEGRFLGCLVLSPDEIAWFEKDGTYRLSRDNPPPSISVRGRQLMFTE